jgi:thiol-disulfide isomerase/thioredoxin
VSFGDRRDQVLVVTFFDTSCLPCLADVPYLQALHARPGVSVVAVSVDPLGPRALRPFRDQFDLRYPIALADDAVLSGRSPFGRIPGIPATFLLARDRSVRATVLGQLDPETFEPLLDAVLALPTMAPSAEAR